MAGPLDQKARAGFYTRRFDRIVALTVGACLVLLGVAVATRLITASVNLLLGVAIIGIGALLIALVVQSARSGFLTVALRTRLERRLDQSVPITILTGHELIHRAEEQVLKESPGRFWISNLWFRRRDTHTSPEFESLVETLHQRVATDRNLNHRSAMHVASPENWSQFTSYIEPILDAPNGHVRFFFQNPLAVDCAIGSKSAVLSFPAGSNDREFAFVIHDSEVTEKIRGWYEDQVWDNADVHKKVIDSAEDVAIVLDLMKQIWVTEHPGDAWCE